MSAMAMSTDPKVPLGAEREALVVANRRWTIADADSVVAKSK